MNAGAAVNWFLPIAVLAIGAIACAGESQPATTATPTPVRHETVTFAVSPGPPASHVLDVGLLSEAITNCLGSAGTAATDALSSISGCRYPEGTEADAQIASGDLPVVLVDLRRQCFEAVSYIAWWQDGWHLQSAEGFLQADAGSVINGFVASTGDRARVTMLDDATLGIIQENADCGSGAPQEAFLLLKLVDSAWSLVWDSDSDARTALGHRTIRFSGDGLDRLQIDGDSWRVQDGKNVFAESNAGPHRYFAQTWVRRGSAYELADSHIQKSPYNTLVEFVYALGNGDVTAALTWVASAELVDRALELGLKDNQAGERWAAVCAGVGAQESPPCTITNADHSWSVEMVPDDRQGWLVSAISRS